MLVLTLAFFTVFSQLNFRLYICHKKTGEKSAKLKKRGKEGIAEIVQTLLVTLFKTKAVVFPPRCLDYANTRRRKFSQPCVAYVKTVWKTVQPFYERGVA